MVRSLNGKKLNAILVKEYLFTLATGNFMVEGTRITPDGFADGRSRNKKMHYIFAEDWENTYSPATVRDGFPYAHLLVNAWRKAVNV